MDRNNSISSNSPSTRSPGPFAYQRNLLERANSRSGNTGSLSRSNSASSTNQTFFGTVSGATTPTTTPTAPVRRWTPTHRSGSSLDVVRGKWEARAKAEAALESREPPPNHRRNGSQSSDGQPEPLLRSGSSDNLLPASPTKLAEESAPPATPPHLKRRTLPASMNGSPLAPDVAAALRDAPEPPASTVTPRVRRFQPPSATSYGTASIPGTNYVTEDILPSPISDKTPFVPPYRTRRANTADSIVPTLTGSSTTSDSSSTSGPLPARPLFTPTHSTPTFRRRPTSFYGTSRPTSLEKPVSRPLPSAPLPSRTPSLSPDKYAQTAPFSSVPPSPVSSTMSPAPYRSSHTSDKRSSMYGDNIVVGRRLGRHLPRIASGDAGDDWEGNVPDSGIEDEVDQTPTKPPRHERRTAALVQDDDRPTSVTRPSLTRTRRDSATSRVTALLEKATTPPRPTALRRESVSTPTSADDVAGVPGRLRLSRDRAPSVPSTPLASAGPVPLPKSRWGLWADTQRHLLHAYEYLCHVGEAQQWIEVCLGEDLGFGVVEMDEGLRNGVVLAKLVRVFQGEAAVRRIHEVNHLEFPF